MKAIFWIVFACCIGERLWELARSTRNQRQLALNGFKNFEPLPRRLLMVGFHTAWIAATLIEAIAFAAIVPFVLWLICAAAVALAFFVRVWALSTLGTHWNISIMAPNESGKTDSPQFVSAGPYRYIRHPNYLAVILELASIPVLGGAYLTALLFSLVHLAVLRWRILEEERHLFSRPGYREAVGRLPRFVPRLSL